MNEFKESLTARYGREFAERVIAKGITSEEGLVNAAATESVAEWVVNTSSLRLRIRARATEGESVEPLREYLRKVIFMPWRVAMNREDREAAQAVREGLTFERDSRTDSEVFDALDFRAIRAEVMKIELDG